MRRRIQEEEIEEEQYPVVSMDTAGYVGAREEYGSKKAQEVEGEIADASEGNHKLLTICEGELVANRPNYVLLYVRGEVRVDKNGGYKGSSINDGGCVRVIIRPPHCVTVIIVHNFFKFYIYNINKNKTDSGSKFAFYHTIFYKNWFLRYYSVKLLITPT